MLSDAFLQRVTKLPGARRLWSKLDLGTLDIRIRFGVWKRPPYAYGVYRSAELARRLGIPAISIVELGVAGGRGLLALEQIGAEVGEHFGIRIETFGFDSGEGMPEAQDYRDLPHVWAKGYYKMDVDRLRAQLTTARLILGDIRQTIPAFLEEENHPPLGFVSFDLDYYSSTVDAFGLLKGASSTHLPRMYSYFDDIMWPETACHNPYIGEQLAIREFNESHQSRKLCQLPFLRYMLPHPAAWQEQIYVFHNFEHPLYTVNITPSGPSHTQLPL